MTPYYLAVALLVGLFLLWRLTRVCKRCNQVDWGAPGTNFLDGLNRWYCQRFHRLDDVRLRIPESGPAVVVSNHVSGLDPLLLIAASRRPLRFLIAKEQYERVWLRWLFRAAGCIPVDRESRPHLAMRSALKRLKEGEVVALFPHGKIHLDSDPPRRLKPGAAHLALATGSPLIPVRITGIRGEGHVVLAVFLRSRARLTTFEPLDTNGLKSKQVLQHMADVLDGREAGPDTSPLDRKGR